MIELGGECFVVGQNQGGASGLFDDLRHGEGLAGAGDAEQHLMLFAVQDAAEELIDGRSLVATRTVVDADVERHIL